MEYYTMSDERAKEIASAANLSVEEVREFCLGDWAEGQEHQYWLDNAPVSEIVDWIRANSK